MTEKEINDLINSFSDIQPDPELPTFPIRRRKNRNPDPNIPIYGEIYLLISPDAKKYVGQTIQGTYVRWDQHCREALTPSKDHCRYLNNAINLHGKDAFKIEILWRGIVVMGDDILNILECKFIREYNTLAPFGYNLRDGGNGTMSEEAIQRMIQGNVIKTENKKRYIPTEKLPRFVLYHREVNKKGTVLEGYRVCDHPKGTNKSFLKQSMSMEEKKNAAIVYKEFLDASAEFVDNSKKLPTYIKRYKAHGYMVRKPKYPSKYFQTGTDEENLQRALEYLDLISHA